MKKSAIKIISSSFLLAALVACSGGMNTADTNAANDAAAAEVVAESTSCYGSFVGIASAPPKSVRIAARNNRLASLTPPYILTGNDALDNAATGGGGIDGGMYLEGTFDFSTDAKCAVTSGTFTIYGEVFSVFGTVNSDRTFDLNYGYGPISGKINSNNTISGTVEEGGNDFVKGVLSGKFTPTKVVKK